MSEHDATPDPMDQAYAHAEAVLSDEAARAARRARVLADVAQEAVTPAAAPVPMRRSGLQRGGWLAAAGVAGLGVFLATHLFQQAPLYPQSPPAPPGASSLAASPPQTSPMRGQAAKRTAPASVAPRFAAARTPQAHAATFPPAARAFPLAPEAPPSAAETLPPEVTPPPPIPVPPTNRVSSAYAWPAIPAPPLPPAPVVVAGSRQVTLGLVSGGSGDGAVDAQSSAVKAQPSFALAAPSAAVLANRIVASAGMPFDPVARLAAAAAAGRIAEVKVLLAQGVFVDAADADGDTALMKSIQADQPAVAVLLRSHGASLDRRNRAGASARDMAAAKGDPKLSQALGLEP